MGHYRVYQLDPSDTSRPGFPSSADRTPRHYARLAPARMVSWGRSLGEHQLHRSFKARAMDLSSGNTPPAHPVAASYRVRLFRSNCERSDPNSPTSAKSACAAQPWPSSHGGIMRLSQAVLGDHPQQRNGPFGVPGRKPVATHITVCIAGSRLHITPPATLDSSAGVSSRWSCCRTASCVQRLRNIGHLSVGSERDRGMRLSAVGVKRITPGSTLAGVGGRPEMPRVAVKHRARHAYSGGGHSL